MAYDQSAPQPAAQKPPQAPPVVTPPPAEDLNALWDQATPAGVTGPSSTARATQDALKAAFGTPEGAPPSGRLLPGLRPAGGPPPVPPDIFDTSPKHPVGEFGIGLVKGLAKTAIGTAQSVNRGASALGLDDPIRPEIFDLAREDYATATTPGQKVGQTVEQIGEVAAPIPSLGKGRIAASLIEKIPTAVGRSIVKQVPGAIRAGVQTEMQTGSDAHAATAAATAIPVGAVLSGVTNKLAHGFSREVTDEGREAFEYLGGKVTGAQATNSSALNTLENIAEAGFGGGRYRKFLTEQEEIVGKKAQELIDQFSVKAGGRPTVEQAGKAFEATRESAHTAAKNVARELYRDVDAIAEQAGGVRVPLDSLKALIDDEAKRTAAALAVRGGKPASLTKAAKGITVEVGEEVEPAVAQLDGRLMPGREGGVFEQALKQLDQQALADATEKGTLSFMQAHELRAALGAIQRQAHNSTEMNAAQTERLATMLKDTLDESMTAAAKDVPDLTQKYKQATAAWRAMAQNFEEGILEKLARVGRDDPRMIVDTIIKPGRVADITNIRRQLRKVDPTEQTWAKVQTQFTEDLLFHGDELRPGKDIFDALIDLKPETVAAIYPRGVDQGVWKFARVLKEIERNRPGTGKIAIQLAQPGAAASMVLGRPTKGAGMLLLSPLMLSRVMTNGVARNWLIQGMRDGAKKTITTEGARAVTNLSAWLLRQGLISQPHTRSQGAAPPDPRDIESGRASGPGPRAGGGPPVVGDPSGGAVRPSTVGRTSSLESLGVLPPGVTQAIQAGQPPPTIKR